MTGACYATAALILRGFSTDVFLPDTSAILEQKFCSSIAEVSGDSHGYEASENTH